MSTFLFSFGSLVPRTPRSEGRVGLVGTRMDEVQYPKVDYNIDSFMTSGIFPELSVSWSTTDRGDDRCSDVHTP